MPHYFVAIFLMLIGITTCPAADDPTVMQALEDIENYKVLPSTQLLPFLKAQQLKLRSQIALIVDYRDGTLLYGRNIDKPAPIASLTKLMTAMIILDARQPLSEAVEIDAEDKDYLKFSRSRLKPGILVTREDLLWMALVASENRAAAALARTYPGGTPAFVQAMNIKARQLHMSRTRFTDATGLDQDNVSTARDLLMMMNAAYGYPLIRQISTTREQIIFPLQGPRLLKYRNTNHLIRSQHWNIGLSKTGYINEAGYCLLMQAEVNQRPLLIILLNSAGLRSKFGDANRISKWLQEAEQRALHKNKMANS